MTLSVDLDDISNDNLDSEKCPSNDCNCCCNKSQDITFEVCEDVKDFTIQDVQLNCEGRFLKVRVELDKVCPGRKVTVGVLLCENIQGTFLIKGFKVCELELSGRDNCKNNVPVGEFCFVLPDHDLCCRRTVRVKVIAHYSSFPSFPFCPC